MAQIYNVPRQSPHPIPGGGRFSDKRHIGRCIEKDRVEVAPCTAIFAVGFELTALWTEGSFTVQSALRTRIPLFLLFFRQGGGGGGALSIVSGANFRHRKPLRRTHRRPGHHGDDGRKACENCG